MTAPTKRQAEILRLFEEYCLDRGYPPSLRTLASATGLASTSTVWTHMKALCRKGLLERTGDKRSPFRLLRPTFSTPPAVGVENDRKVRELGVFLGRHYPDARLTSEHAVDTAMRLLDPNGAKGPLE